MKVLIVFLFGDRFLIQDNGSYHILYCHIFQEVLKYRNEFTLHHRVLKSLLLFSSIF